jgi:hypothetical protein
MRTMANSVPREVAGLWYPVPTPRGLSLAARFRSEEACAAFCEAFVEAEAAWGEEMARLEDKHADEMYTLEEEVGQREYDSGFEDGKREATMEAAERCQAGLCEGYTAGRKDAEADLALSAESA